MNILYTLLQDETDVLRKNMEELQKEHKNAGKAIGDAAGLNCDWHDNFEFDNAQRVFGILSEKLNSVNEILSGARILQGPNMESGVGIGKKIIISIDGSDPKECLIGGYQTPIKGRVSYNAPIIQPLLGKNKGDIVYIEINDKEVEVEILDILE